MSTKTLLTAEDLWKIVANGNRYELSRGELVPMTPVGFQHSAIVARFGMFLSSYVTEKRLGIVGMEGGFKLEREPDTLRAPDIHFVSKERLAKEGITQKFADYPPDLAVEVLSPEDRPRALLDKIGEYLQAGVKLVWVIDPERGAAAVYRSLTDVGELGSEGTLDGEEVVPGFRCPLQEILG